MPIYIQDDATSTEIFLGRFFVSDVEEIVNLVKMFGFEHAGRTHTFKSATLANTDPIGMWITTNSTDIDDEPIAAG